jgi:hypothetical protein
MLRIIERFRSRIARSVSRCCGEHRENVAKSTRLPRSAIGRAHPRADAGGNPELRAMIRRRHRSIKLAKSKTHHTWTDDEIEQYRVQ